ncbi:MAG: DUF368 domain-containing protein [Acholeplasmatales bacterium]|nr:DUF368 domain-containing protein [Acholeplasmatales bacterium]
MKRAIGIFLKGILIGFISIAIPGLSASTIAIALGLYFLLIDSISSIFSNFKKSIAFLIPIMLGFGVGSILGATLVSKLYDKYPLPVTALIIGFVIGSIPEMFREIRETKAKKRNFIITLIVMAGVIVFSTLAFNGNPIDFEDMELYEYFILAGVGLVTSTTLVIPGVDFAMILLSFGYYYAIIGTINDLTSATAVVHNLTVLGIYLVSYGVGAFFVSLLIKKAIGKHEAQFRFANLGFILVAPIVVTQRSILNNPEFMNNQSQYASNTIVLVSVILFVVGYLLMYLFNRYNSEYDLRDEIVKKRNHWRFYFTIARSPIKAIKILRRLNYYKKHRDEYTFEERYKVFADSVLTINKSARAYPKVFGFENIPEGTKFFISNHQGKFDGLAICEALHDIPYSFIADSSMINYPFYNVTPELIDVKLVTQGAYKENYDAVIRMGNDLANGMNHLAFPEGGYKDNNNNLREFHSGCLKPAYMAKCTIIPICLYDSWKVFGKSSFRKIYPEVHFLKPIYYDEYKDLDRKDLAELIKSRINEKLIEIKKEKNELGEEENEVLINQQENQQQ